MIDRYLDQGWHIFPLRAHTKVPLTTHGVKDASTSRSVIREWRRRYPDCGWGIACEPSRIFVVDLDGDAGINAWNELAATHPAPRTLIGITGGGGRHIVYHDPHTLGRNSASRIAANIDTRGRGGYIVAAPSIHPNGQPYHWEEWVEPARIPDWIANTFNPQPPRPPTVISAPAAECDRYGEVVLDSVATRLAHAAEGHRNDALNHAAYAAGKLVRDGHAPLHAVTFLRDLAYARGLHTREVEATWRSGYHAGYDAP